MRKIRHLGALALFAFATIAAALEPIPVHGPARVALEDPDLLADTVLEVGVLAVSTHDLTRVFIGDGITPGGLEIHPANCVRSFADVHDANTNLNMYSYSITFGPWSMHGDAGEFDLQYGTSEPWLSMVRDSGQSYIKYDFTMGPFTASNSTYSFAFLWSGDEDLPVLQVSTNLLGELDGFVDAPLADVVYDRPDATHVRITYTDNANAEFIFFRLFARTRLASGAYVHVPLVPLEGITMGSNTWTEWPDVDGKIAAATTPLASTAAVAAVSGRVDAIEADYVVAADIADFATNGAVASVERRLDRLEYPDWCTLYWGTNVMSGSNLTFPIPTNFPTKNLRIYIIDTYASVVDLVIQTNWVPKGDCTVEIVASAASAQTNRDIRLKIAGTQIERLTSQSTRRKWVLCFDSLVGYWHVRQETFGSYNYIYPPSGYQAWTFPSTLPKTVEEWLERYAQEE